MKSEGLVRLTHEHAVEGLVPGMCVFQAEMMYQISIYMIQVTLKTAIVSLMFD